MAFDRKSAQILNYRPQIQYIEPPTEPEKPNPIVEPQKDDLESQNKLYNLANAVNVLGAAVQARINEKSKNIKIKLNPVVDAAAISAMKRLFGDEDNQFLDNNETYITYDQYKQCRELLCNYGAAIAERTMTSEQEISDAKELLKRGLTTLDLPGSLDGGLRPELSKKANIIEPINMGEFQAELIKLLIREIWKIMIYKPFKKLPVVGSSIPKNCPGIKLKKSTKTTLQKVKDNGAKGIKA